MNNSSSGAMHARVDARRLQIYRFVFYQTIEKKKTGLDNLK